MSKISKLCLTIALVIVLLITPVAAMAQTIEPVDPNGGGSIIVYIALDVDGNGKVGEGDPLVAGAKVNVGHGTNCDDVATAYETLSFTTNSDGRFDINDATDCYFLSVADAVERYDVEHLFTPIRRSPRVQTDAHSAGTQSHVLCFECI